MTTKQDKFIRSLKTAKNPTEAARQAGYTQPSTAAYKLLNDEQLQKKIQGLGIKGLDSLERIATNKHANEIAQVQAAKTLVETAYGRPKDNKSTFLGDVTINVMKIEQPTVN